ncbi:MAG: hypothetical protein P9E24_12550 [Candidatus Competibacter sp.]|nr:hypothetical protein [Candidatus Competibacter sp.]MDG4582755.1 hypothetical protein [Candidatus Competibacter sp.]
MTEDSDEIWAEQARRFASNDLGGVRYALGGGRRYLGSFFDHMQNALHWAVDAWLCLRGERCRSGWHDQEARFLRIAPPALQDEYLRVAGDVTQLASDLLDILGVDRLDQVAVDNPTLDTWRRQAMAWLADAETFVGKLTKPDTSTPQFGLCRIESGVLRGRFDGLTPCLLLVRSGKTTRYQGHWAAGKIPQGIFDFGDLGADRRHVHDYSGFILPLSLCRNARLRKSLETFARLLLWPVGVPVRDEITPQPPPGARGRRLALQTWLDEAGLGCLKMVDKESVTRWTRFHFTLEATQSVLCEFDYVTAVEDGPGQAIRILEHEAFRWTSHGDLLDRCQLDSGEDASIIPFRLYMVSALSTRSELCTDTRERERLFRPLEYWAGATTPNRDIQLDRLRVRLEPYQLLLTFGERTAKILFSEINDPFPELLEWLRFLATGDLPIGVAIDEEGSEARIVAHACGEGRLIVAVLDRWENAVRTAGVVETDEFLSAFRRELTDFLQNRFDVRSWPCHEDEEGQSAYRDRLLEHSFLVGADGL